MNIFKKFIIDRLFNLLEENGPKDTTVKSAILILLTILVVTGRKQPSTDTATYRILMKPKASLMETTTETGGITTIEQWASSSHSRIYRHRAEAAKIYLLPQESRDFVITQETQILTRWSELIEPSTNASLVEVVSTTEPVVTSFDLTESNSASMDFHLNTKQALLAALVAQYKILNQKIDDEVCYLILRRWQAFFPSVNSDTIDNNNAYPFQVEGGSAAEQDFFDVAVANDSSGSNTTSSISEVNESSDTFLNSSNSYSVYNDNIISSRSEVHDGSASAQGIVNSSYGYALYNNNLFINSPEGSASAQGFFNSSNGYALHNNGLFHYNSEVEDGSDSESESDDSSDSEADDGSESGDTPARPRYEGASAIFVPQLMGFFLSEPGEGNSMDQVKLRICEVELDLELHRFSRLTFMVENASRERPRYERNFVAKLRDELCLRQFELSIRKAKTHNPHELIETRPGSEIRWDVNIEQLTRAINTLHRQKVAIYRLKHAIYRLLQLQ